MKSIPSPNAKAKYRSNDEQYALILKACLPKELRISEIVAETMTSQAQLVPRLDRLAGANLLKVREIDIKTGEDKRLRRGHHTFYSTTAKGEHWLELYRECLKMISTNIWP